jgi:isoquinoline 1-oxidoreductase subunit beta
MKTITSPTNHTLENVSRRRFVQGSAVAAGSLVVGMHLPALAKVAPGQTPQMATTATPEINAWVVVKPDDTVIVRVARSEMGQGTMTGLAQLVCEEMNGDWKKVTTEYPTPGQQLARSRVWQSFGTGGSRGIRESQDYVRKGGAAAKMMLVQAAANEWKVPITEIAVTNGVISHTATKRTTSFGKVAAAAAKLTPPAADTIKLKDPKEWTIAGKRIARLDTIDKTNGKQIYGMDLNLPGMMNAAMKDSPVFGGKIKRIDDSAVLKRPGVKKVVRVGESGVAVIADTWWRAKTALDALSVEWDEGPNAKASSAQFAETLKTALNASDAVVGATAGDAKKAIESAARKIEAVYSYPHQNHACMETMNATVRWTPEKCEGWVPTQNGEAALAAMAEAAGLPPAKCEVYKLHLGGGFGRRGATDYVTQAVRIAKEMPGVWVKMIWSREEDMAQGRFHPVTQCKLTAGLDDKGEIVGLHMRIAGQSILAGVAPQRIVDGRDPVVFQGLNLTGIETVLGYTFPNFLVDHAMRNPHVPPGFWRGVNLNQNAIYLECFLDEIAAATKQDPLALRRKMMAKHPKQLAALEAVAKKIEWDKPAPAGMARGFAQTMGFGSYVAAAAEVSVSKDGVLKIHRIVTATDCGVALNPQQIEAQVEGSFVYGLAAMLYQECTVKDGRIEQTNFQDYPCLKLSEMPKVETIIIESGGFWGGVGEPTIAVAAPAVMNAIFAATGKRIRDLPLKNHKLVA